MLVSRMAETFIVDYMRNWCALFLAIVKKKEEKNIPLILDKQIQLFVCIRNNRCSTLLSDQGESAI
jgi:hypothetical protein